MQITKKKEKKIKMFLWHFKYEMKNQTKYAKQFSYF